MATCDPKAIADYEWLKNLLLALYAQTLTPDLISTALLEAYSRGYNEGRKNGVP